MKFLFRWMFSGDLMDEYFKGWKAGVNQQLYDPKSAEHGHLSESMYWYGEEE